MIWTVFTPSNATDFATYKEAKEYAESLEILTGEKEYTIESTNGEIV